MSSQQLTVLQMLPSLESGGVERGTVEISRALCENGHHSIVVSGGGRMVADIEAMGAQHLCWDIGKKSLLSLMYVFRLRRYLKQNHVDILHARSRLPAWIAYLAWKGMDKKTRPHFVTTVHGLYSVKKYSSIMTRGEVVIAVSETVRDYIRKNYVTGGHQQIELVYRGVDADEFPYGYTPADEWLRDWYAEFPCVKGKIVLTLPGRLTRLKGHRDFIDLVYRLHGQGYNVHGLIVGGEDPRRQQYAEELYTKVASMNMENMITFTGLREDIREIYAASDIVFSLSEKPESFGRTTLEALSMGVPVVGYNHGGVGEILSRLFPQGQVSKGDVTVLAEKVADLLDNGATVNQQREFTLECMSSQTLQLYQTLVAGKC